MSNRLVHINDTGVPAAPILSSVAVFDGDEHCELIKGGVDVLMPCRPHSLVVLSTNSYVNWGYISTFTSGS